MTYEAFYWNAQAQRPSFAAAMRDPGVTQYFEGWGRPGDVALVATEPRTGQRLGMAWARLYPADKPSYGFVAPDVPEVSTAVIEEVRGMKVGSQLVEALFAELRREGFARVSYAIEHGNTSIHLSSKFGGRAIDDRDGAQILTRDLGLAGPSGHDEPGVG